MGFVTRRPSYPALERLTYTMLGFRFTESQDREKAHNGTGIPEVRLRTFRLL